MTSRRKKRAYAMVGVAVGWLGTASSVIFGSEWWWVMLNVTFFGATCAAAGLTWWLTRP